MCGINGIIHFNSAADFGEKVRKMNDALAHRGPDDAGLLAEPGIALGHRRLSIIDLSSAGHQPMFYADNRYAIVYNGELYNFRELRHELSGQAFTTGSDTEVILASYAKWGETCLDRFNGMFAFAIYDKKEKTVFIARDRLGIKPLYYWQKESQLVFSSEMRGIFASGFSEKKTDAIALKDYLRYQTVHAPATIISDIKMLMPGHFMKISVAGAEIKQWWAPAITETDVTPSAEEAQKKIRTLLREAVERRLMADVPFGAFLSGGIDSSIVVGLMSEVSKHPVKTFSVTFDDSEFSEAVYAKRIARDFKTVHTEIKLKPEEFLRELPEALDALDHPGGDGPNTYVVSKATKSAGVTMALSGLGGDELFCGYAIFKQTMELNEKSWLNYVPKSIRLLAGNIMRKKPGVASEKKTEVLALDEINFESFYPVSRKILPDREIDKLLKKNAGETNRVQEITSAIVKKFPYEDQELSRVSLAEMTTYMQNVLLRDTDQMSMAHALEVRVPFLDYKLVEYVLNLPDELKYPSSAKKLLVDACKDLLPEEIYNRKKMGFTFPWQHWMKNELRSFCDSRIEILAKRNEFNRDAVRQLWQRFLKDDPKITWSRVWPLVVLAHWLEKNEITS